MVKFLIEKGANINSKNNFGGTPLDAAGTHNPFIDKGNQEFLKNRALIKEYLIQKNAKYGTQ